LGDYLTLPGLSKNSSNERHKYAGKSYRTLSLEYLILLIPLFFLSGCATLAISALGAGAGIGFPYVLTDCADRTINFPFEQVNKVTPQVLKRMDIDVVKHSGMDNRKRIIASAKDLDITIDMERVTTKTTKITVNAKKGAVRKDTATSEEIINQMERMLAKTRNEG